MSETNFVTESPLKMMKDAFYFTLKVLFCSKDNYFFCLNFWIMQKNSLIRKLISKFITPPAEKQTIALHILSNISRSKGNQAMKVCPLIEYETRNILFEKLCTKRGGKTIPRPYSEKSKFTISLNQESKLLYSLFLMYAKLKAIEIY